MSVRHITKAFRLDLECRLKFVVVALADNADDENDKLWPSVGFIAWKTGQSERQVQRSFQYLRQVGALIPLERESGGRHRSIVYRLDLEMLPLAEPYARSRRGLSPYRREIERLKG